AFAGGGAAGCRHARRAAARAGRRHDPRPGPAVRRRRAGRPDAGRGRDARRAAARVAAGALRAGRCARRLPRGVRAGGVRSHPGQPRRVPGRPLRGQAAGRTVRPAAAGRPRRGTRGALGAAGAGDHGGRGAVMAKGSRLAQLLQTRGLLQERRKPRALPLDKGHDPIMRILLATCLALLACLAPVRAADAPLTVFAAASLKESMDEAAAAFRRGTGREIRVSYAGSSALARQIEQGAPADVFVSADLDWMDALQSKGLIDTATRSELLGNTLVLVAPKASAAQPLRLAPGTDLRPLLGERGRIALALVDSVPAG